MRCLFGVIKQFREDDELDSINSNVMKDIQPERLLADDNCDHEERIGLSRTIHHMTFGNLKNSLADYV